MYSTNLYYFGHLKEMDTYTTTHLHNDMWQIVDNKLVSKICCKLRIALGIFCLCAQSVGIDSLSSNLAES